MKVVATIRQAQGTGASRRLRHQGKVPGILYGGRSEAVNIELDHNPLFHSLKREKFHASVLEMELDGRSERVLLRDFQTHPYRPLVLHIDFQRVAEDQKIHVRVPLHFVGGENSPAVKASGAIIGHVRSDLDISCLPRDLPEFIEVDLSHLTAQDTVHVRDLKLPAGVSACRPRRRLRRSKKAPSPRRVRPPLRLLPPQQRRPRVHPRLPPRARRGPLRRPSRPPARLARKRRSNGLQTRPRPWSQAACPDDRARRAA